MQLIYVVHEAHNTHAKNLCHKLTSSDFCLMLCKSATGYIWSKILASIRALVYTTQKSPGMHMTEMMTWLSLVTAYFFISCLPSVVLL